MPSLEKHIQLSRERTGKDFKEVHEWLDGKELNAKERVERHRIVNVQKFLPMVEEKFGREGVREYLQHLQDDYEKDFLLLCYGALKKLKFW
ncbi:MAG: hypothetical protein J4478_04060 [Candidatus Diapherotrites archaeon]|uniref:Uncharacterized protein n=1 Tax=Candidatus Iainarchaeum sp. TaxID=3101447 RepID=A0A7J4KUE5_9ARCH|nr:MAG: metal dependent phosphohydrolase [archaeon GW2011_AR21]MBS3058548.1 hypothetical protein [Candidatus Diapherotrites archaeon]HIH21327.1 hypothetical protein [Candidatus Diapherotrites archaeon]HIH32769.1 hypothetical protein [Candidatus Diapherotrites archaeon]